MGKNRYFEKFSASKLFRKYFFHSIRTNKTLSSERLHPTRTRFLAQFIKHETEIVFLAIFRCHEKWKTAYEKSAL